MSHPEQRQFCKQVKRKYPEFFKRKVVVDVGSLDINGSNRSLFRKCFYTGIDVYAGKNVNVVGEAHLVMPLVVDSIKWNQPWPKHRFYDFETMVVDVMISTEALEHDKYWEKTLTAMYLYLKPGGLMLITCAAPGREEHGTTDHHAWCSPGTNDHYQNVSFEMLASVLHSSMFDTYHLSYDKRNFDLQFYGIKKNQ